MRLPPEHLALLRCPSCHSELSVHDDELVCATVHSWPIVEGVPVFSDVGRDVERRPADHVSHQPPQRLLDMFAGSSQPWLHLGAGASLVAFPNSIELETAVFAHTHVVGDVHHLPFADGSLGGVLALNVFEHLSDPDAAARELRRCIVPGGRVAIQTAFLQPLHADPFHFYNATESGVRRWFERFDIDAVEVPANFHPVYALSWMLSDLLYHTGYDATIGSATIDDLAKFWYDPESRHGLLWDTLQRLPDATQRILAAGFEITATRPPSPPDSPDSRHDKDQRP